MSIRIKCPLGLNVHHSKKGGKKQDMLYRILEKIALFHVIE